ncbi:MAG: hypothetical protein ACXVQJ_00750 [Actinomycetota bacterium]
MEKQLDANWVSIDAASRATGVSATSIRAWCAAGAVRSIAQTSGRVVDLSAVRLHGMPESTAPEAINARLADRDSLLKGAIAAAGSRLNETILELQDLARGRLDD